MPAIVLCPLKTVVSGHNVFSDGLAGLADKRGRGRSRKPSG